MIGPESVVVRAGDLVTAPLGAEIAMLNIDSGSYFVLDDIAAVIWDRLQSPTTPSDVCDALRQRYEVPPAQCEADVLKFLRALHGKGLVRIVE